MTINSKMLTGMLLLCIACSNGRETPKGLKYTVVRSGDGKAVKSGEFLVMNMLFKDGKDSAWFDTKKSGFPATAMVADTSAIKKESGVEEIFRLLSKGDSVTFTIPAKTLFEKTFRQPLPPKVDPTSEFTFIIGVKDVLNREQFTKVQNEIMAKQNEKYLKDQAMQLEKDTVAIDNFLREKNIKAQKTASGMRYIILKQGKGPLPAPGQTVKVNYAGHLLDGKYFDTNIESVAKAENLFQKGKRYEPYPVQPGRRAVIAGWEEILMTMNKGSKITVYIPSTLAYGPQRRSEVIGENSILVFDLETVDIQSGK